MVLVHQQYWMGMCIREQLVLCCFLRLQMQQVLLGVLVVHFVRDFLVIRANHHYLCPPWVLFVLVVLRFQFVLWVLLLLGVLGFLVLLVVQMVGHYHHLFHNS